MRWLRRADRRPARQVAPGAFGVSPTRPGRNTRIDHVVGRRGGAAKTIKPASRVLIRTNIKGPGPFISRTAGPTASTRPGTSDAGTPGSGRGWEPWVAGRIPISAVTRAPSPGSHGQTHTADR